MFLALAAFGGRLFAAGAAVAGGALALAGVELVAADGADGGGVVGCAAAEGGRPLALVGAVTGRMLGCEFCAAFDAVQAVDMGRS